METFAGKQSDDQTIKRAKEKGRKNRAASAGYRTSKSRNLYSFDVPQEKREELKKIFTKKPILCDECRKQIKHINYKVVGENTLSLCDDCSLALKRRAG